MDDLMQDELMNWLEANSNLTEEAESKTDVKE
jgi:hypothetical protein